MIWTLRSSTTSYLTSYQENGISSNQPCFLPGIVGRNSAIRLSADLEQNFVVHSNFYFQNIAFSISAWIYIHQFHPVMIICAQWNSAFPPVFLTLATINIKLAFTFDDLYRFSMNSLITNRWYYVALIYNRSTQEQIIYLDGIEEGRWTSAPYSRSSNRFAIGGIPGYFYSNYFDGLIDRLSIVTRAMTAEEVLTEATLSAYYSFNSAMGKDSGPNQIDGLGVNVTLTSGINGKGLLFSLHNAFFIARSFLLLDPCLYSYSLSFWLYLNIKPSMGHFISMLRDDGQYIPIFGFDGNGNMTVRSIHSPATQITAPYSSLRKWIHIVLTHRYSFGLTLFLNGSAVGYTNISCLSTSSIPMTLIVGFSVPQMISRFPVTVSSGSAADIIAYLLQINAGGSFQTTPFNGIIDEFRIYSRYFTIADIQTLMQLPSK